MHEIQQIQAKIAKKTCHCVSLVLLILYSIMFAQSAYADSFPKGLVFLGDSLTDQGNYPGAPMNQGLMWPVAIGERYNFNIMASTKGGTNYAYAFAMTSSNLISPSVVSQITMIPASLYRKIPVLIFAGEEDIFFAASLPPTNNPAQNLGGSVQQLQSMGFNTIVVLNTYDLGKTPAAGTTLPPSATLTAGALSFNSQLQQVMNQNGHPIVLVDIYTLFNSIFSQPAAYGFTNVTAAAPSPINTAGYLFYSDGQNFTSAGQQIIADYVYALLNAPAAISMLAEKPFTVLRGQNAVIRQQMYPQQPSHDIGRIYPFIAGNYTPHALPSSTDLVQSQHDHGENVTVGVSSRISKWWTIGAAGGVNFDHYNSHMTSTHTSFSLREEVATLFASYQRKRGYINGIANVGFIHFGEIERKFRTGPLTHHAHGTTNGLQGGFESYGAYYIYMDKDRFATGPILNVDIQGVSIHGYQESGSDVGTLAFKSQSNYCVTSGIGWEALSKHKWHYGALTTDVNISLNRQWAGGKRHVRFHEVSLGGVYGSWPIQRERIFFGTGNINFSGSFYKGVIASIGCSANMGEHHLHEYFFTAGLTMPLGK